MRVSKLDINSINVGKLGYWFIPKINAAGRLSDMTTGIRCLLSHNLIQASSYAKELIKFFEDEASKITCVLKEVEIDICDVQLVEDDGKRT